MVLSWIFADKCKNIFLFSKEIRTAFIGFASLKSMFIVKVDLERFLKVTIGIDNEQVTA